MERAQERARNDPSINNPNVANALRQPQLRRQGADQGRNAPAFDIEQRATQRARLTHLPSRVEMLIEMRGANIAVTFEMPGAPDHALL